MRTPSPPYCRLDLVPPLADRFIIEVALIDYGPVLLLMPFGFHLAMDTLPSGTMKTFRPARHYPETFKVVVADPLDRTGKAEERQT